MVAYAFIRVVLDGISVILLFVVIIQSKFGNLNGVSCDLVAHDDNSSEFGTLLKHVDKQYLDSINIC